MSERDDRLLRCFASVFPGLSPEEIRRTSAQEQGIWDSLATVTLISVIQEEFQLEIEPEMLEHLDSFEAFRRYIFATIAARE
jgi:acyl carrier protein